MPNHVGKYGIGTRNENGEALLDFVICNDLYVSNTAFAHKSRHITTRQGSVKDWTDPTNKNTKAFFSQIDYIICKRRFKSTLIDSRSYGGARTSSDHKIVCAKFQFRNRFLTFKKGTRPNPKYDCAALSSRVDVQKNYTACVLNKIQSKIPTISDSEINENDQMTELFECLKIAANETVGLKPKSKRVDYTNDDEIVKMTEERHRLRMSLNNNKSGDWRPIRSRINKLENLISKRLKHLKELRAEQLAAEITSTDESRKMFNAVRELSKVSDNKNSHIQTISVQDDNGDLIVNDAAKAAALKTWFEQQFTGSEEPLPPFDGPPRPLNTPITAAEVQRASMSLKNNRGTGPDGIQNELLKYGGSAFHSTYSEIINRCFEKNTHLDAVGEAMITPLQKPNKPKGSLKNIYALLHSQTQSERSFL